MLPDWAEKILREFSTPLVCLVYAVVMVAEQSKAQELVINGDCRAPISGVVTIEGDGDLLVNVESIPECAAVNPPPGCESGPKPVWTSPSAERNNFEIIRATDFASYFGDWPGTQSSSVYRFRIPKTVTLSLPFTVPEGASGVASYVWEGSPAVSGGSAVSISTCEAGVLTPVSDDCIVFGTPTGGNFSMGAGIGQCQLEAGDYFFNVSDVDESGVNTCTRSGPCQFLVQLL